MESSARSTQLTQLEPANFRDRARKAIRSGVITGELQAGKIYPVNYFSSELGVSATPVREALFDLVNEGLMKVVRNRGFRVVALSEHDLDEIFELRLMLEVPSVGRVVGKLDARDLSTARRLAEEISGYARQRDLEGFLDSDREFHLHLLRPLHNERLVEIVGSLRDQTRLYGLPQLARSGYLSPAAAEHFEILEAIEQGDASSAEQRMKHHLVHTRGVWAGHVEDAAVNCDLG